MKYIYAIMFVLAIGKTFWHQENGEYEKANYNLTWTLIIVLLIVADEILYKGW